MVAGPVTGAEGDEQTGRDAPELRAWPEFAIPAQRAEETSTQPSAQAAPAAEFGAVPTAPPIVAEPASEFEGFEPSYEAEPQPENERPRKLRSVRSHRSRMRRQTSNGVIVLACAAVIFLVLHRFLPDAGGIGSLLETWLPWVGVPILLLVLIAAIVHTKRALVATLIAALAWAALYGPALLPRGSSAAAQLRIFSEDVNGNAQETTASGTMALAQHADIVALEDMYSSVYETNAVNSLNTAYQYHSTEYEFGLWSKYPISNAQPLALGTTQTTQPLTLGADEAGFASSSASGGAPIIGALKADLSTPQGTLTVYLVHMPQPVLGDQGFAKSRDLALTKFVQLVQADHSARIAVIGDINVAATDRQFGQLTGTDGLTSAQQASGSGFGFTWPAEFPIVRLDDVLTRGLKPLRSVVLPAIAHGQTHLPIQVDLDY